MLLRSRTSVRPRRAAAGFALVLFAAGLGIAWSAETPPDAVHPLVELAVATASTATVEQLEVRLKTVEAELAAVSRESAEMQRDLLARKKEVEESDQAIVTLREEIAGKRRRLEEKLEGLPGVAERVAARDALQQRIGEAFRERSALGLQAGKKPEPASAAAAELAEIDRKIRMWRSELGNVNREIAGARNRVRRTDPELAALTAEIMAAQHEVGRRLNEAAAVTALRERYEALRRKSAALAHERRLLRGSLRQLRQAAAAGKEDGGPEPEAKEEEGERQ